MYAIEFQLREGDCLAFRIVYAAAESRVKPRLQKAGTDGAASQQPGSQHHDETVAQSLPSGSIRIVPPLPACNSLVGGGKEVHQTSSLAVLDMANLPDSPQSQMEAIGWLVSIAVKGECVLHTLALEKIMEIVEALAQSEDAIINLLAARWIHFLVQDPKTKLRLASLVPAPLLDRFLSNAKCPTAQRILCQVLDAVRVADGRAVFQP